MFCGLMFIAKSMQPFCECFFVPYRPNNNSNPSWYSKMKHGNLHKRIITENVIRFRWGKSNEEMGIRICYEWKWIIHRIQYLLNNSLNKWNLQWNALRSVSLFVLCAWDSIALLKHHQPEEGESKTKNVNICHSVRSHCCRLNGCSVCSTGQRSHSKSHKQTDRIDYYYYYYYQGWRK